MDGREGKERARTFRGISLKPRQHASPVSPALSRQPIRDIRLYSQRPVIILRTSPSPLNSSGRSPVLCCLDNLSLNSKKWVQLPTVASRSLVISTASAPSPYPLSPPPLFSRLAVLICRPLRCPERQRAIFHFTSYFSGNYSASINFK